MTTHDKNADPREAWGIPRRICIDKLTAAELAIVDAVRAVEAAGADLRLTHAVIKLGEARNLVADFVDGVPFGEGYPRPLPSAAAETCEGGTCGWAGPCDRHRRESNGRGT